MKRPTYRIEIPKPCHEDWALMTPTDRGRFCASCQKQVVDFTGYTDREIARLLGQSKGELCGRFRDDQLEREITAPDTVIRNNQLKVLFSSLLAAASLVPLMSNAQKAKTEVLAIKTHPERNNALADQPKELPHDSVLHTLKGVVVDSLTNEPLVGAVVRLNCLLPSTTGQPRSYKDLRIQCYTNATGEFQLKIPADFFLSSLVLRIFFRGDEGSSPVEVGLGKADQTNLVLRYHSQNRVNKNIIMGLLPVHVFQSPKPKTN